MSKIEINPNIKSANYNLIFNLLFMKKNINLYIGEWRYGGANSLIVEIGGANLLLIKMCEYDFVLLLIINYVS